MQLIIVFCLIAKLALVSGDCDVGKTVNDFDLNKFTGTWYILYYLPNEHDDNVDGIVATFSVPDGNVSNITACDYDKRHGRTVNFNGQISDWDNTGFNATCDKEYFPSANAEFYVFLAYDPTSMSNSKPTIKGKVSMYRDLFTFGSECAQWNGRHYIVAVDYDRYYITKYCYDQSNTVFIHVAFRCAHPDDATMKDVKNALSDNGIPFEQLKRWNVDRCKEWLES